MFIYSFLVRATAGACRVAMVSLSAAGLFFQEIL